MKSEFVDREGNIFEISETLSSTEKFAVSSVVDELKDFTEVLDERVNTESIKRAEEVEKIESDIKKSAKKLDKKINSTNNNIADLSRVTDKLVVELNQAQSALDIVTKSFSQFVKHKHKMSFEFVVGANNTIFIRIKKLFKNLTYHEMMIKTDASYGNQGEIYAKKLRGGFIQIKHVYPSPACPTYKVSNMYVVNFEQKTYIKN